MAVEKQTVEYIASVEHLDQTLTVVTFRGWAFLLFSIVLSLAVLVWAFAGKIPITVDGKAVLVEKAGFQVYGFFSILDQADLRVGTEVKVAFNAIDASQYGMLKGKVVEVGSYPVSLNDAIMTEIPSESLRQYLLQGDTPKLLAVIAPVENPNTPSKFAWTTHQGPPQPLQPGLFGTAHVLVEELKPISFVIP
jgi:hypothetical protein